ncbi:hypothetical protein BX070DRAFT_219291 [Coemansia spiralis]|nr:hypothetical protein BX070DRAFT_219291 [Coemansia spiralis]
MGVSIHIYIYRRKNPAVAVSIPYQSSILGVERRRCGCGTCCGGQCEYGYKWLLWLLRIVGSNVWRAGAVASWFCTDAIESRGRLLCSWTAGDLSLPGPPLSAACFMARRNNKNRKAKDVATKEAPGFRFSSLFSPKQRTNVRAFSCIQPDRGGDCLCLALAERTRSVLGCAGCCYYSIRRAVLACCVIYAELALRSHQNDIEKQISRGKERQEGL